MTLYVLAASLQSLISCERRARSSLYSVGYENPSRARGHIRKRTKASQDRVNTHGPESSITHVFPRRCSRRRIEIDPVVSATPADTPVSKLTYANKVHDRKILMRVSALAALIMFYLVLLAVTRGIGHASMAICLGFTGLIIVQASIRALAILHQKTAFAPQPAQSLDAAPLQRETNWPFYTVLVPLKDEAHMINSIITNLSALDYPRSRLQILLITEEDDPLTCRAAARRLGPPFESVIVPRGSGKGGEGGPRTKPNALNAAMRCARGDIITIYDAEDCPHPSQLKEAARAFDRRPEWGALQAPLDYFNDSDSWLAAQFSLEYAAQFHVWLPLMARLRLPFPLGGTSNHIRREAIDHVKGWDSYNVTEDADLSFRLAAAGYDIGYITPPTQEEAVAALKPWIAQRTRWMKGYLQTWLVHMDQPFAPGGLAGLKRQLTLQLTLGTVLLAGLLHTPVCLGVLGWAGYQLVTTGTFTLSPLLYLSLGLGYGSGLIIGLIGALRAGKPALIKSVPVMPLYWLLLFIPTWRAVYDYYKRPYYWSKTTHGLTAHSRQAPPAAAASSCAVSTPS